MKLRNNLAHYVFAINVELLKHPVDDLHCCSQLIRIYYLHSIVYYLPMIVVYNRLCVFTEEEAYLILSLGLTYPFASSSV